MPLNFISLAAVMFERKGLRPWEVRQLDRWTIANVIFHARKEDGSIHPFPPLDYVEPVPKSPKESFWAFGKSWFWPEWYIEERWAKHLAAPKPKPENVPGSSEWRAEQLKEFEIVYQKQEAERAAKRNA